MHEQPENLIPPAAALPWQRHKNLFSMTALRICQYNNDSVNSNSEQLPNLVRNVGKSGGIESVALGTSSGDKLVEKCYHLLTWIFVILILNHARLHTSHTQLQTNNRAQTSWNPTYRRYIRQVTEQVTCNSLPADCESYFNISC